MKGKISDINDLVTQPLKMFGALLYGPNEYRVNKNFDKIYKQLNQNNDETEFKKTLMKRVNRDIELAKSRHISRNYKRS